VPGWRKAHDWRRRLKSLERLTRQVAYGGGAAQKRMAASVRDWLSAGRELARKVAYSLLGRCEQPVLPEHWDALEYFHRMLEK
jgi:hypothetical protein